MATTKVMTAKDLMKKTKEGHKGNTNTGVYTEVDVMAELDAKIQHLKTEMKKHQEAFNEAEAALSEKINLDEYPADKEMEVYGNDYMIKYGKKAEQKTIADMEDTAVAFETHQEGLFFKVAKVTLADMNKYLDPEVLELLIKKERTGNRSKKITQKV